MRHARCLNSCPWHRIYLTLICTAPRPERLQRPKYAYDAVQQKYQRTSQAPTIQSPGTAAGSIEPAIADMKITVFLHESPSQQCINKLISAAALWREPKGEGFSLAIKLILQIILILTAIRSVLE